MIWLSFAGRYAGQAGNQPTNGITVTASFTKDLADHLVDIHLRMTPAGPESGGAHPAPG
jgi:hypothetical protein